MEWPVASLSEHVPTFIALLLLALSAWLRIRRRFTPPALAHARGAVLVLTQSPGAQSPRALAHAVAIRDHTGLRAVLLAEAPLPAFQPCVAISAAGGDGVRTPLALAARLLRGAAAVWRALDVALAAHGPVRAVVVNVPPTLPTLPVALAWARVRAPGARVVVDWHNTAASILRSTSADARVVAVAAAAERACAGAADAHWAVSAAFARALAGWRVRAAVVRDAPPRAFRARRAAADAPGAHALLRRVAAAAGAAGAGDEVSAAGTPLTALGAGGAAEWRARAGGATRVAVSATSWTPDEDFGVLFAALARLDAALASASGGRLLLVITGRGPLRAGFERRVADAGFAHVAVWCAWLAAEDYPHLLGTADVGVCMHASSSGLDLPMKVVDMLGCGLPVVAFRYQCIGELVRDGANGVLFGDEKELADALFALLFAPEGEERLAAMRKEAEDSFPEDQRWDACWKRDALPTLSGFMDTGVAEKEN